MELPLVLRALDGKLRQRPLKRRRFLALKAAGFLGFLFVASTLSHGMLGERPTGGDIAAPFEMSSRSFVVSPPPETRRLEEDDDDDDDCPRKPGWPLTIGWIFVVLYMFLGIAIVCDELFVPALEIVAEKWDLSKFLVVIL